MNYVSLFKLWANARKYKDQQINLTDCLSFAIMERLEIKNVLTFDNDFKIHGFEVSFWNKQNPVK